MPPIFFEKKSHPAIRMPRCREGIPGRRRTYLHLRLRTDGRASKWSQSGGPVPTSTRPSRCCRTGCRGCSATDTLRHSSRHTAEAASRTAESPRKPPVHPITHETPTPPKGYPAVYVPQECRANTQPGQPNTPGSRPPPAPISPAPRRRSDPSVRRLRDARFPAGLHV